MPARGTRRATVEAIEDRPGSGQSPASLAKDLAAQPALLAGIAKKAPIRGGKRVAKKTYSFAQKAAQGSSSSWGAGRRSAAKKSGARLEFVRAQYQKGENEGNYSGAVYGRGVPSYASGRNEMYKEKLGAKLLAEVPRFNTELKTYTFKVYAPEQAIMVREAAKMVCAEDEVSPARSRAPRVARAFERMPSRAPVAPLSCDLRALVRVRDGRKPSMRTGPPTRKFSRSSISQSASPSTLTRCPSPSTPST